MSRFFILLATMMTSGLPAMAATGLSGVIFTNLNKRHFVVDLSAAPTNMIKLNLDTGQFDTGGTTITITNINSLFTNSVTFPPSFTTNYTNVFITVDTNGNLVPLGYDKTQFAIASSELHVKNSPRITNLFTLDDVTLGTMTYQWPLNGTNDGLLSIIAILPATGFDPYPKVVLKWLGSATDPITNLYVLTNHTIINTNSTLTNLVVTNLFIMDTNFFNPTQFLYDPSGDNIVNIKNQPHITNAVLSQVLTIDGLAYSFPTQYQPDSLLYDATGSGVLSWGGSLTNPINNLVISNLTVLGAMTNTFITTTNYFLVGGTNITVVTTTSGTNVTFTVNSSVSATNQFTPALIDAQNFLVPISYVGVGASNGPSHSYMITYATNASRLLMHGVGTGGLASDAAIYTEPDGTTSFLISGPTSSMTWTPAAGLTLAKSGGGEQINFGSSNAFYHVGSTLFVTNSNNPSLTVANTASDSITLGLTGTTQGRVSASSFLQLSGGTTTLIIHNSLNKIYPNTTGMDLGDTGHTLNGIYGQTNSVIYFGTNLLSTDGANHLTWNGVVITVP